MADPTDEEIGRFFDAQMAQEKLATGVELSDEEIGALYDLQGSEGSGWNIGTAAKQFGAGAVEGTVGLPAFAIDVLSSPLRALAGGGLESFGNFPVSNMVSEALSTVLPEPDENYRYSRAIGSFVGPSKGLGLLGKLFKGGKYATAGRVLESQGNAPALLSSTAAALGAQGAEDLTGDRTIAPLVGAVITGSIPSLVKNVAGVAKQATRGATQEQIRGSAANTIRDYAGLSADDVGDAIARRPEGALGSYMTTAELTDNAAMAQLEKELSKKGAGAIEYARRAGLREAARNEIIDSLTPSAAVNRERLGATLRGQAGAVREQMISESGRLWDEVPRNVPIDVAPQRAGIGSIINSKQAGLGLGPKITTLVNDLFAGADDGVTAVTSGALQDIRSDALTLLRDSNPTPFQTRVLNALVSGADDAMERGLVGEDFDLWRAARDATRAEKEMFGRQSVGGALTNQQANNANLLKRAFRGDEASVAALRAVVRDDPAILNDVRRGVLDMIGRDAQGRLTPNKMANFVRANENGVRALFGQRHLNALNNILRDLQSEARVGDIARFASKGNSATAQNMGFANAISKTILGKLAPGSGVVATAAEEIRKAANVRTLEQVEDLILRAALEPEFAYQLLQTPNQVRIMGALDYLRQWLGEANRAGVRAGGLEMTRISPNNEASGGSAQSKERQSPKAKEGSRSGPPPKIQALGPAPKPAALLYNRKQIGGSSLNRTSARSSNQLDPILSNLLEEDPTNPITAELVRSVIKAESGGDRKAVSPKGAQGLMQLMPDTAREMMEELGLDPEDYDPYDAELNVTLGTAYLKKMYDLFGEPALALAAYNAGPGRVSKLLDKTEGDEYEDIYELLPKETQKYVKKILKV